MRRTGPGSSVMDRTPSPLKVLWRHLMLKRLILTLSIASAMAVSAVAQTGGVSLAGVITKFEM
jgi:hypothetical protein